MIYVMFYPGQAQREREKQRIYKESGWDRENGENERLRDRERNGKKIK